MMKAEKEFTYEIIKPLGVLSVKGGATTEVNIISICGQEPKIDVRHWFTSADGNRKMLKGVDITPDEAKALVQVLSSSNIF